MIFCSRYLHGVETKSSQPVRNYDASGVEPPGASIFSQAGRPLGKPEMIVLYEITLVQAHRYVLFNFDKVNPFFE